MHVPTLAAGISKLDEDEDEEDACAGVEFLLWLYSLVEADNLALAENILALRRENAISSSVEYP